jgi:hypothetical protein
MVEELVGLVEGVRLKGDIRGRLRFGKALVSRRASLGTLEQDYPTIWMSSYPPSFVNSLAISRLNGTTPCSVSTFGVVKFFTEDCNGVCAASILDSFVDLDHNQVVR